MNNPILAQQHLKKKKKIPEKKKKKEKIPEKKETKTIRKNKITTHDYMINRY